MRLTLSFAPGKFGKRVFDVHQDSTFQELHDAIAESFNRGSWAHLFQFKYPIESHAYRTAGMKKADLLEWCQAFGVPTEGLKVPELKKRLGQNRNRLEQDEQRKMREFPMAGRQSTFFQTQKAFLVEDEKWCRDECYYDVKHVGSESTKLSDVMLAKDDVLSYVWDLGAHWPHVLLVESSRDATPEEAKTKVKLVMTNELSEPEEWAEE